MSGLRTSSVCQEGIRKHIYLVPTVTLHKLLKYLVDKKLLRCLPRVPQDPATNTSTLAAEGPPTRYAVLAGLHLLPLGVPTFTAVEVFLPSHLSTGEQTGFTEVTQYIPVTGA